MCEVLQFESFKKAQTEACENSQFIDIYIAPPPPRMSCVCGSDCKFVTYGGRVIV